MRQPVKDSVRFYKIIFTQNGSTSPRFLKQAVNDVAGSDVFVMPAIQSAELRRYLRKKSPEATAKS